MNENTAPLWMQIRSKGFVAAEQTWVGGMTCPLAVNHRKYVLPNLVLKVLSLRMQLLTFNRAILWPSSNLGDLSGQTGAKVPKEDDLQELEEGC